MMLSDICLIFISGVLESSNMRGSLEIDS
jgi:hypothetical protein